MKIEASPDEHLLHPNAHVILSAAKNPVKGKSNSSIDILVNPFLLRKEILRPPPSSSV